MGKNFGSLPWVDCGSGVLLNKEVPHIILRSIHDFSCTLVSRSKATQDVSITYTSHLLSEHIGCLLGMTCGPSQNPQVCDIHTGDPHIRGGGDLQLEEQHCRRPLLGAEGHNGHRADAKPSSDKLLGF